MERRNNNTTNEAVAQYACIGCIIAFFDGGVPEDFDWRADAELSVSHTLAVKFVAFHGDSWLSAAVAVKILLCRAPFYGWAIISGNLSRLNFGDFAEPRRLRDVYIGFYNRWFIDRVCGS